MEVSKYIELEKEMNKEKGETINAKLEKKSKELRDYMGFKVFEKMLEEVKNKQGFPIVLELT